MIEQVTVFLENKKGRLLALTKALGEADVNMHALTIAETSDYGLVRIVCDKPEDACSVLKREGFRAVVTQVIGVVVPNRPGGLSELLERLQSLDINIEYGYCFSAKDGEAIDVFKVADPVRVTEALEAAGYALV